MLQLFRVVYLLNYVTRMLYVANEEYNVASPDNLDVVFNVQVPTVGY